MTAIPLHLAVGRATVVDVARRIPVDIAIQILSLVYFEDILIVRLASPQGLLFGNFFTHVFNHARAARELHLCEPAQSVDFGLFEDEPFSLAEFRFLGLQIHTLEQTLPPELESECAVA